MEILFVSHKYPPATGGMEKQSFELIEGMRAYATVRKIVYTQDESYFQFFRKLNGRILAMIHRYPKIGVVHFNDGLIAAVSLWHVGYSHLRRVVTLHGLDVVFPLKVYQRFIFPRFNRYDHIVAVSTATAAAAIQRGISSEKISVIANGISHQVAPKSSIAEWKKFQHTYHLPAGKKILMTLGRPVKRKGFSWFIREVLPLLPDDFYLVMAGPFFREVQPIEKWVSRLPQCWRDLYMLFMGYSSDQEALRELICNPAYSSRVKHVGKLPETELGILLSHVEAFLMPNIQVEGDMEGFGLVCLEASASGTTVLAAALEGITDAIQHLKNGIQIESENASAWSQAIQELLNDKDKLKQRHAFRNSTLTHFGWRKMVSEYANLFRELIIK